MAGLSISAEGGDIQVRISTSLPVQMRGAAILALLTAPPTREADPATRLAFRRWCRIALWCAHDAGPEWSEQLHLAVPSDVRWPLRDADAAFKRMEAAINKRLAAAHAARRFLQVAEAAANDTPNRRTRSLGLEGEITRAVGDEKRSAEMLKKAGLAIPEQVPLNTTNFRSRVLRPGLPVLPVAFVLAQAVEQIESYLRRELPGEVERHAVLLPGTGRQLAYQGLLGDVLNNGEFQERLLVQAEQLEALLRRARTLKPERLVRVRLDGTPCIVAPLLSFVPVDWAPGVRASAAPIRVELLAGASPAQAAITLLATLADPPQSTSDTHWRRTVNAFCRLTWERRCEHAGDHADGLQPLVPAQLLMPLVMARRVVAGAMRRVMLRIGAAEVLGPAVQALVNGQDPVAPHGAAQWSLAAEIRRVIEREKQRVAASKEQGGPSYRSPYPTGDHALGNFEAKVTGPGRSVLHLAIAFAATLERMARDREIGAPGPTGGPITSTLANFDWERLVDAAPAYAVDAIDRARLLEAAVASLPAGGPRRGDLVLLWAATD